jgi:uncharacterized protein (DUF58 family)
MNTEPKIYLKSRLLPVVVIVLLLLQFFSPYDGWLILLAGLGGAWLTGYLWVRILSKNLSIRREMRFGWAQVGDRLEERFTLTNRSWVPALWVEVIDHTSMPEYQVSRATGVGGFSTNRWTTQGVCNQRGLFTLGPTSMRSGDPLGIYSFEIHDPKSANLMVTPPIVPLPNIEVAPGGRSGEGRPRPDAPEQTVSSSGVREYVAGDSLRWIHWRTTAHRDELYVRLFEGTPAGDWWIILDMDQSVQVGEGQDATQEHGIILAASLADRGLRTQRSVGLVANSQKLVWLPPKQSDAQRWEILRALALAETGERSLSDLLGSIKPSLGKDTSLILITPNASGKWIETLLPLYWVGVVPTVLLQDPFTFGGTGSAADLVPSLVDLGIAHYVIPREFLDRPETRPGQAGHWEWRVSPTGRAIPISKPQDMSWREIA